MTGPRVRYFAYGSNMLTARLRERVPSAMAIDIGQLVGHVLRWDKRSSAKTLRGVKLDFIRPEKPTENGRIQSSRALPLRFNAP